MSTAEQSAQRAPAPSIDLNLASSLLEQHWSLTGSLKELPSYIDKNLLLSAEDGSQWVFKVANEFEQPGTLELQNAVMARLHGFEEGISPIPQRSSSGKYVEQIRGSDGRTHLARLVSFLPGSLLADVGSLGVQTLRSWGRMLAKVHLALKGFEHPYMRREMRWDLGQADWTLNATNQLFKPKQQAWIEHIQLQFLGHVWRRKDSLPHCVIHGDPNDNNIIAKGSGEDARVAALFDLGDCTFSARIFELAIGCSYAAMDQANPLQAIASVLAGFQELCELEPQEVEALFPSLCMRLAVSVTVSALDARIDPSNAYVTTHEQRAWALIERLVAISPHQARDTFLEALGHPSTSPTASSAQDLVDRRKRLLGPSLSVSYSQPLHITRGREHYLFDDSGRAFLDGVNNVCHVGHCNPVVAEAAAKQMVQLNTNTRYLHENILALADHLGALFPDPLSVCFFVNSGSEANELALRMARCYTNAYDVAAIETGYHGNTSTLIDISSYKHDGPGGSGAPDWVHCLPCPDPYRGIYAGDAEAAEKYAAHFDTIVETVQAKHRKLAALIAEPLIGCGGQVIPPEGWLRSLFDRARATGVVSIADEVQVGFGRVGSHWWAFEQQGAQPDIVTMGKPFGNGHPLGAVITTPAIAEAFANGMEYFNTFGGNPVSCAVGLAVIQSIEELELRENAMRVGQVFLEGFQNLAQRYEQLGDVRGTGMYLGVEFVKDRHSREPAPELLNQCLEIARASGVLFSSDGPYHNVLKIKPPLTYTELDARLALNVFERALACSAP